MDGLFQWSCETDKVQRLKYEQRTIPLFLHLFFQISLQGYICFVCTFQVCSFFQCFSYRKNFQALSNEQLCGLSDTVTAETMNYT